MHRFIIMRACFLVLVFTACNAHAGGEFSFDDAPDADVAAPHDVALDVSVSDILHADVAAPPDARPPMDAAIPPDARPPMDAAAPPDARPPVDAAVPPDDPAARTATAVCTRWIADRTLRARTVWTAGADACALGILSPDAHDDAMRVLNLYRWLAGLPPAIADPALAPAQQACAVMMTANGMLNHSPPTTWRCYSPEGARAAGSSNLALGTATPAASVELYANERDQNLGHRRWVFARGLGATWFGATQRASCMQVFRTAPTPSRLPAVVAWPNPGPAPLEAFSGVWHAQDGARSVSGASVSVRDEGGQELAITTVPTAGNYGNGPAVAWRPSGWTPREGATYTVTLRVSSGTPITYQSTAVRCR